MKIKQILSQNRRDFNYSESLHIYKNDEQAAKVIRNVPVSPQEMLR